MRRSGSKWQVTLRCAQAMTAGVWSLGFLGPESGVLNFLTLESESHKKRTPRPWMTCCQKKLYIRKPIPHSESQEDRDRIGSTPYNRRWRKLVGPGQKCNSYLSTEKTGVKAFVYFDLLTYFRCCRCLYSTRYPAAAYQHISLKSPGRRTLPRVKCEHLHVCCNRESSGNIWNKTDDGDV